MITRRGENLEVEIKHHWDRSLLNLAIVKHRVQMQDHARSLELLTNNQLQTRHESQQVTGSGSGH